IQNLTYAYSAQSIFLLLNSIILFHRSKTEKLNIMPTITIYSSSNIIDMIIAPIKTINDTT
ncbi:TPA: hypothetical protein ACIBXI_005021, partial [Salmonella enterica subsp. diarizonae serovar 61:l,v:z35]